MVCSECGREELQSSPKGGRRIVKHPKDVTEIICSRCVLKETKKVGRTKE